MYFTKWVLACELRQGLAALGQLGSRMLVLIDFMQSEHGHVSPANNQFLNIFTIFVELFENFLQNSIAIPHLYVFIHDNSQRKLLIE